MNAFQDVVFWFVIHKEQVVSVAGLFAVMGMFLTVAAFSDREIE